MKTKNILFLVLFIVLLFPVYWVFQILNLENGTSTENATSALGSFQISLWVCWAILAAIAVYYKWTHKSNLFFTFSYIFIVVGFVLFGYFTNQVVLEHEITTRMGNEYPLGIFSAARNIIASVVMTVFLQLAVFWFTRRWHRR